jgi:hypothetical protein
MAATNNNVVAVTGGGVTLTSTALSNAQVTPFTTVNVGGGTWNYGNYGVFSTTAYSQYFNPTYDHNATAICGNIHHTVRAEAGAWANASAKAGAFASVAFYWNVFPGPDPS